MTQQMNFLVFTAPAMAKAGLSGGTTTTLRIEVRAGWSGGEGMLLVT